MLQARSECRPHGAGTRLRISRKALASGPGAVSITGRSVFRDRTLARSG